jgi:hypothetical protein
MAEPGYFLNPSSWGSLEALPFSDVRNWRNRELAGSIAPGRQPRMDREHAGFAGLPVSENIQDRRNEPKTLSQILAAPWFEDPMIANLVAKMKGIGYLYPLQLPLGSELANQAGFSSVGSLGLTPSEMKQFRAGETPGSARGIKHIIDPVME